MDAHLPLPLPVFFDSSRPESENKTNTHDIALQTYGDTKVEQVDTRDLPEHTKALLEQLMEAGNSLQINNCLCLSYTDDGKDFHIYYRVLLERLATLGGPKKRKIQERHTQGYSREVYNQAKATLHCILKSLSERQAGPSIYNAYYSILKDISIDQQHRLDILNSIENKAMRFWILYSLKSSLVEHDIPEAIVCELMEKFFNELELEQSLQVEELLGLLYNFLDTEPEKRKERLLPILQAHITLQGEKINWASFIDTVWCIDHILKKLEIDLKNWSQAFIELSEDKKLPVEARLYACYYVLDSEKIIELRNAFFQDSTMFGTLEFWRAFLVLGYEGSFTDFLNEPPEKYSLSSFDLMQRSKMHAIEGLREFCELKKTDLSRLGGKLEDIEALSNTILNLSRIKNEIECTYPFYKIILEKRSCECSLKAILEAKKASLVSTLDTGSLQGKNIALNEKAYILPKVLDPEWVEGYEDITFDFFIETIEKLMHEKQELQILTVRDAALHQDYIALFQNWRSILTHADYGVIKSLLDVQDADDNPYVLKLTALAAGILQLFREGVTNETAYDKARGAMDMLVLNTQTCYGGQLQAIDQTYASFTQENYGYIDDPKERAINIVLNSLYLIRKNWVMEDEVRYTKNGKMVSYSPNVADGVFINALSRYLDKTELMDRYECDAEELETYTFLKNRTPKQDAYGRTHLGYDILGIAGPEIGLSPEDTPPVYDFNIQAESWFLQNAVSDKVSIVNAFVESFTFETIWEPLAELLWKKAAEESSFGMLVYRDESCTETLNLDIYEDAEGIIARQDPLAKGILRLLNTLGLDPATCCETLTVYYQNPLYDEVEHTTIYTRLTKEGIALLLHTLGFLNVEART